MPRRRDNPVDLAIAILVAILAAVIMGYFARAHAHDWYEPSCCDNRDCFEARDAIVIRVKGGYQVTLPDRGSFFFSDSSVKPSRNRFYHPCLIGGTTPICLYVPLTG